MFTPLKHLEDPDFREDEEAMVGHSLDNWFAKGLAAQRVSACWDKFWSVLAKNRVAHMEGERPCFPIEPFAELLAALKRYLEVTSGDPLVHRKVVGAGCCMLEAVHWSGLPAPENLLWEAGRLESWFLDGVEPKIAPPAAAARPSAAGPTPPANPPKTPHGV
jgi:hypothetical protein